MGAAGRSFPQLLPPGGTSVPAGSTSVPLTLEMTFVSAGQFLDSSVQNWEDNRVWRRGWELPWWVWGIFGGLEWRVKGGDERQRVRDREMRGQARDADRL